MECEIKLFATIQEGLCRIGKKGKLHSLVVSDTTPVANTGGLIDENST